MTSIQLDPLGALIMMEWFLRIGVYGTFVGFCYWTRGLVGVACGLSGMWLGSWLL